uniref:microtubule-severing ATPase n=1 Tax=Chenopodium quinoa TaxID=63459 RepID=A0A803LI13_CHEQI
MSFWKGLIDSLNSVFSNSDPLYDSNCNGNPNSSINRTGGTMEVGVDGSKVSNERTAGKLKGYFDLATGEIDKAVRAEEWGLVDDAILHYRNAQRILAEGSKTTGKITSSHPQAAKGFSKPSTLIKTVPQRPSIVTKSSSLARDRTHKSGASKSNQDTGGYDAKLVEMINTVVVDKSPSVKWEDVAGLDKAKQTLFEMVILPTKRKDLFTGLRRPPRGLLLFGPPGNGKTMLAKAVASECNATFFNVSASTLTSKWVGEGEKLVRTLFMVAISRQPSVIFMDEIDSMMSTREANEHDASRRLKSEFLVQFDGVTSNPDDLVIVIGATNKPQELDDAVLRRLVKRIYIPLPDQNVRRLILNQKLKGQAFSLPGQDLERLVRETEGMLYLRVSSVFWFYGFSDLQALCEEAAMMPIRELGPNILTVKANQVRPLRYEDFQNAMTVIRPSLSKSRWEELERWNKEFGSS